MGVSSEESQRATIRLAMEALVRFKREFNRDLTPSVLAELYVALEFDLTPAQFCNNLGFDLLGADGSGDVERRCEQFRFRLSRVGQPQRRLPAEWNVASAGERCAETLVFREKYRKYQATEKSVKASAEPIVLRQI
jgi:hypothetical protein